MEETIDDIRKLLATEKSRVAILQKQLAVYENDGIAKLFYSLNRKSNEMADLLNNTDLSTLDLSAKDDKTFERIKVIIHEAAGIATAVRTLGEAAGIIGNDEIGDTQKPKFRRATTPESMADQIGELAGKKG